MADLVRVATAGSVDDGKSTLIGRLLFDSGSVPLDQVSNLEQAASRQANEPLDLARLTDGLRAEREQGITIDVAYRYFSTPTRRFILADTPGHFHYTRNMVTGASGADIALVLVDASRGPTSQTRRHIYIAGLLGVGQLVICLNKMDLVGWSSELFEEMGSELVRHAQAAGARRVELVPTSALLGDNVVKASANTPWYEGKPLLELLETLEVGPVGQRSSPRLAVQYVVRKSPSAQGSPCSAARYYAGTVTGGRLLADQEVVVLPAGRRTRLAELRGPGGRALGEAAHGQAVTVRLADDLDVGRGDVLSPPDDQPLVARGLEAMVCAMSEAQPLASGSTYHMLVGRALHTVRLRSLVHRVDTDTLEVEDPGPTLGLNEIGRAEIVSDTEVVFDPYRVNRHTGGFVLVDPHSNLTVGAGTILGAFDPEAGHQVVRYRGQVSRWDRRSQGATVWLSGLPASGKSTIGACLERLLVEAGRPAYLIDGDNVRHGLCADLGFGPKDRQENVRRLGELAKLFADAGLVAVVAAVSPYRVGREEVRRAHQKAGLLFFEVHVDTPLETCELRDPKGLYARARRGELEGLTGVGDPYEPPQSPDAKVRPQDGDPASVAAALARRFGLVSTDPEELAAPA